MKLISKLTLLLLISFSSTIKVQAQNCNCSANLSFVINTIEKNYSGYKDKVNATTQGALKALTDSLHAEASHLGERNPDSCMRLIKRYLHFFRDGHMYIYHNGSAALNEDSIRKHFKYWPSLHYTKDSFISYLMHNKNEHKLEGIWRSDDNLYKVGLIFKNGDYQAFILRADSVYWVPGQIKFRILQKDTAYKAIYYEKNHTADTVPVYFVNAAKTKMITGDWGTWYKINLSTEKTYDPVEPLPLWAISFSHLSSKTNLLTIRSFSSQYIHDIDSVINAHDSLIRSTENLIIDLRNNGGGADVAFDALKKYLYTQPYSIIGLDLYCTKDNIANRIKYSEDTDFSKEIRGEFKLMADSMSKHLGGYWSPYPTYIKITRDTVLPLPKRIAILINGNCASTTEQFLIGPVKNSKKAIIMGTHSAGVLDYANVNDVPMPCSGYELGYPTSRSKRIDMGKGIDNKGVIPDIKLNDGIKNWVKYAEQYLEKQ